MNEKNLKPYFAEKANANKAARSKKGMTYYTTRLKEQFVKNKNLKKSLDGAQLRYSTLIEISNETGLSDLQVKELSAITSFLNKFLDKTFASQTESKNEVNLTAPPTVFMPEPKELPENE